MIKSIWRLAHLVLAAVACSVLIVASITGAILAFHTAKEKIELHGRSGDLSAITLAQSLSALKKAYPEITDISVDKNQLVNLHGFDRENKEVKAVVDPQSGQTLGSPPKESPFIQQVTSLHRSLFMHETGRFVVGLVAFLFFLITLTGIILFVQQLGIRRVFGRIGKESVVRYLHLGAGRLLLIPILIISLTGTFLFAKRFGLISEGKAETSNYPKKTTVSRAPSDFAVFKQTKLSEVTKLEFPFMEDPDEFFVLKLHSRELTINQFTGEIVSETKYPFASVTENLILDLHTGRTSVFWAVVLLVSSLSILVFIWTGFAITFRKLLAGRKGSNAFSPANAEIVVLVGSQAGSTRKFAAKLQRDLLSANQNVFVGDLNDYTIFPKAKHLLIFTSTYGRGEAPKSAVKFEHLLDRVKQPRQINFSVLGFGSTAYVDFCAYAVKVDRLLSSDENFRQILKLHTVDRRSQENFSSWRKSWCRQAGIHLCADSLD